MVESSVDALVNGWLLDYACKVFWDEFIDTRCVCDSSRDIIQGMLQRPVYHTDPCVKDVQIRLLLLQCKLADGEGYDDRYTDSDPEETAAQETVLEGALETFLKVIQLLNRPQQFSAVLQAVSSAIRIQAVFVCCRGEDFEVAQGVFDRLWITKDRKSTDQNMVEGVLESKNKSHSMLEKHSYTRFLDEVIPHIQHIHDVLPVPFLHKAAEGRLEYRRRLMDETREMCVPSTAFTSPAASRLTNGNKQDNIFVKLPAQMFKGSAEALGDKHWRPTLSGHKRKSMEKKLQLIRAKTRREEDSSFADKVNAESEDDRLSVNPHDDGHHRSAEQSPTIRHTSSLIQASKQTRANLEKVFSKFRKTASKAYNNEDFQYRKNRERPDRHRTMNESGDNNQSSSDEPDSFEFADKLPSLGKKPMLRKSLAISSSSNTSIRSNRGKARQMWTEKEEAVLIKAVRLVGKGHWAVIRNKYKFYTRTSVDLKDKWRNLVKKGLVEDVN